MVWLDSIRLRSGSPQMRRKALENLIAARKLPSFDRLVDILADPDPEVRCAAAKALTTLGEQFSAAAQVGTLAQISSQLRTSASLAQVQDPRALKPLLKSARDSDPLVRVASITALGQELNPSVTETLLGSLNDSDSRVRSAAAQALELHADPAHLNHFLALLADAHFEVRVTAIQYLSRICDPSITPALIPLLGDPDSDVRRAAALALGEIRNPAAIKSLVLCLIDEEPAVRHAAAAALEQIDPRWIRTDAAKRAIPQIGALRTDPRPWIASVATKVFDKLKAAEDTDTQRWYRESGIREL
jgi:HEAT repeat protein